jgi:hypothetical protein
MYLYSILNLKLVERRTSVGTKHIIFTTVKALIFKKISKMLVRSGFVFIRILSRFGAGSGAGSGSE